jgi:hypothetical protein
MGFQRAIPHQIDVARSKKKHLWAVRRSYGHNKHINAILRAQNAVKREREGASRGDGVFLTVESTVLKLKLKLKLISNDMYIFDRSVK